MTNCIFYSLFFVLFLNVSFGSLRYSQVNRVFMSIYKGMVEATVITITDTGEPLVPYYSKEKMATYIEEYLQENLSRYTTDYSVSTNYYVPTTNAVCSKTCRKVSINLKANINVFYEYDKTQTFVVRSGDEL